jgi:GntR family transcriptional regulator, vanillate catabolism transcriptional regulator
VKTDPESKIRRMPAEKDSRSSSQTTKATLALREMLVQGRFHPGERLREVPLAAELRVSRIPLHLALERLAHEGFLSLRSTRGFVVQGFSPEDIRDAIELRGLLEGSAARLATERLKDDRELDPLRHGSREMVGLVRQRPLTLEAFKRYIELNAQFHNELLDLAHSRMLRRAIEQACSLPFASPSAFLNQQHANPELRDLFVIAADQHCLIVEAIAHREGMRAETLTREHARVARRNLDEVLRNRESLQTLANAGLMHL